jgi:hypothetical protein
VSSKSNERSGWSGESPSGSRVAESVAGGVHFALKAKTGFENVCAPGVPLMSKQMP